MKSFLLKAALPAVALLLAGAPAALAQSGGFTIGASTPADASAALDIVSTTKGLLAPRLTQAQVNAIANPATGLLVFQTDGASDYYYNAGTPASPVWQPVATLTASSPLSGSGTAASPLTIATATASTTGALTGTDFTTFNNKVGTASNGLTKTGTNVALGGTLTAATTTIAAGANSFAITQNGGGPPTSSIDQSNYVTPNPFGASTGNQYQTFTAGITGNMSQVELQMVQSTGNTVSFSLNIRNGAGLSGAVLYTTSVTYTGIDPNTPVPVTIPVGVSVTAGQVYTIQVTGSSSQPNSPSIWIYSPTNTYAGGSSSAGANIDYLFRTTVQVPDPAPGTLFIASGGSIGIATATPSTSYKLDVNGSIRSVGAVATASDVRLKQNIRPLGQALAAVQALRGVRYTFRQAEFPAKNLPGGEQIGFLAQEVEKVYPELVSTDAQGYKAVNYAQLTPVLLEAIKEQQAQLEVLKAANASLRTSLDGKASAGTLNELQTALQTLRAEVQTLKAGGTSASTK